METDEQTAGETRGTEQEQDAINQTTSSPLVASASSNAVRIPIRAASSESRPVESIVDRQTPPHTVDEPADVDGDVDVNQQIKEVAELSDGLGDDEVGDEEDMSEEEASKAALSTVSPSKGSGPPHAVTSESKQETCYCSDPVQTPTDILCSRFQVEGNNCYATHLKCIKDDTGKVFEEFEQNLGTYAFLCRRCVNQPTFQHPDPQLFECVLQSKSGCVYNPRNERIPTPPPPEPIPLPNSFPLPHRARRPIKSAPTDEYEDTAAISTKLLSSTDYSSSPTVKSSSDEVLQLKKKLQKALSEDEWNRIEAMLNDKSPIRKDRKHSKAYGNTSDSDDDSLTSTGPFVMDLFFPPVKHPRAKRAVRFLTNGNQVYAARIPISHRTIATMSKNRRMRESKYQAPSNKKRKSEYADIPVRAAELYHQREKPPEKKRKTTDSNPTNRVSVASAAASSAALLPPEPTGESLPLIYRPPLPTPSHPLPVQVTHVTVQVSPATWCRCSCKNCESMHEHRANEVMHDARHDDAPHSIEQLLDDCCAPTNTANTAAPSSPTPLLLPSHFRSTLQLYFQSASLTLTEIRRIPRPILRHIILGCIKATPKETQTASLFLEVEQLVDRLSVARFHRIGAASQ